MREVQIRSLRERFLRRLHVDELAEPPAISPVPVLTLTRASASLTPTRAQASLAPARVLLVASDRRFRALAATLLSQRGHEVIVARGDEDVSELAQRRHAEVVVLDASASLTAVARQAARLGSLRPRVGIVAVSADAPNSLTALPVLAKWSSFNEVLAAVDRACADARSDRGEA